MLKAIQHFLTWGHYNPSTSHRTITPFPDAQWLSQLHRQGEMQQLSHTQNFLITDAYDRRLGGDLRPGAVSQNLFFSFNGGYCDASILASKTDIPVANLEINP